MRIANIAGYAIRLIEGSVLRAMRQTRENVQEFVRMSSDNSIRILSKKRFADQGFICDLMVSFFVAVFSRQADKRTVFASPARVAVDRIAVKIDLENAALSKPHFRLASSQRNDRDAPNVRRQRNRRQDRRLRDEH
jgi:hypothetical protein